MAYFARIGLGNKVTNIIKIDNSNCQTEGGVEKESIGLDYIRDDYGSDATWVQCSINTIGNKHYNSDTGQEDSGTPLRANYPSIGWNYDVTNDIFYEDRPTDKDGDVCNSWTLNTTTGLWGAPITMPTDKVYLWDESAYQADNTAGWVARGY